MIYLLHTHCSCEFTLGGRIIPSTFTKTFKLTPNFRHKAAVQIFPKKVVEYSPIVGYEYLEISDSCVEAAIPYTTPGLCVLMIMRDAACTSRSLP